MPVELSDSFFARIAGWDAVKQARSYVAQDRVLSSDWAPPLLKGIVQEGSSSYRAGLVIKNAVDVENVCTCRSSREWGTICAHSVAVGLHYLKGLQPPKPAGSAQQSPAPSTTPRAQQSSGRKLLRTGGAAGELAEIHIILPPNFEQALPKGKVMLCFEGKWRGGRGPLDSLPITEPFCFSEQDVALLAKIEALAGGATPAMLILKKEEFLELLPFFINHPRITLGKSAALSVLDEAWFPRLKAELLPSGEIRLGLQSNTAMPLFVGEEWVFCNRQFQRSALPGKYKDIFSRPIQLSRQDVPGFLLTEWPKLQARGNLEANFRVEDFRFEPLSPAFSLELKGGLARLEAVVRCAYGQRSFTLGINAAGAGTTFWLPAPNSPLQYSTRAPELEAEALQRLTAAGFIGPDAQGRLTLTGQNQVLNFFARDYPRWQRDWKITLEERLERSTATNLEPVEPQFQITPSGIQWFDLSVTYSAKGGEQFSPAEIQRLLLSGQSYTRLKNGKIALLNTEAIDELQEVLLDCAPQQHTQGYRLRNTQAGFIEATLREQGWKAQAPTDWRQKVFAESGAAKLECPPLRELEAILRPYQKTGVAWLHFLRANHFGGILADEMGLGKTLQALAFLQTLHDSSTPVSKPHLIICPTSLVWNWVAEARKFTPRLKMLALHGSERHANFADIPQHDLVVTSYVLVRRDAEKYREFEFDTVVLDEAQHIKNRQTQNAQAVKSVRCRHRLVLTGTPLENSVLDLWSIFDFLMPGYLGAARDFRDRYEVPITQQHHAGAQARLARRLRPFILRRTKREVAPELPEKLEQVSYCELTDEQRSVYQQLLEASRREVFETVGAQGIGKGRMVIFNALLRLRQVCCDLRLLKLESANTAPASGKVNLFNELLEEAFDGGHRVLVFSQFVSMLSLLREELSTRAIEYCYLDGATVNRAEVVARFQQHSEIPVFLISLKAGGVGLNLTGADTVIHFDPWWNPAVEAQATDRAHRIGQQRVVTSYKLITRGTVEEKILALQTRKRELIQSALGSEEALAESLSWAEIQELLSE